MTDSSHEHSTRQTLIEATSKRLRVVDEGEVRILDICQETNLSTSVIYGHFRSRQGLIDASLLHIFSIVTDEMIQNLEVIAAGPFLNGSFVDTLYELVTNPDQQAQITRQRQMFLRVCASALSRPSIRPGFFKLYEAFMVRVDEHYDEMVRRQLLSSQLTGHQWALFFEGQMLSRAFHDLSSDWDNQEEWRRATHLMLSAAKPEATS